MEALILAAGQGSRLEEHTINKPKCLIKINNRTLIERNIQNLKDAGIEKVFVVTGYLHHMLEDFICEKFGNYCQIIYNNNSTLGSGSSLISAAPYIKKEILIVESDLLYDKRIIERFLIQKENALAKGHFKKKNDEMRMILKDNYIINMFVSSSNTKSDGDWVGFTKLSNSTVQVLQKQLLNTNPNQGKEIHYGDFILPMIKKSPFIAVDISDLPWVEIDDFNDLEQAKQIAIQIDNTST